MNSIECRKCGRPAEYKCSLRKGDVYRCEQDHKTIHPLHTGGSDA